MSRVSLNDVCAECYVCGTNFNDVMLRWTICLLGIFITANCDAESPFAQRGYYMTFMRMPAFGLAEWKQIVNCVEEDGGNTLLLWTAGGFQSKQFPETWAY